MDALTDSAPEVRLTPPPVTWEARRKKLCWLPPFAYMLYNPWVRRRERGRSFWVSVKWKEIVAHHGGRERNKEWGRRRGGLGRMGQTNQQTNIIIVIIKAGLAAAVAAASAAKLMGCHQGIHPTYHMPHPHASSSAPAPAPPACVYVAHKNP